MSAWRYAAACLEVLTGLLIVFGSLIGGYGVHQHGDAIMALPLSAFGIVVCLSAYILIRHDPVEPKFRKALSVFLAFGSLQLAGGACQLIYRKVEHIDPSESIVAYDTTSYPFVFIFGSLCLVALWVLNVWLRPRPRV